MRSRFDTGRHGESTAAEFLARSGLKILQRNFRCAMGEIDIIAREGRTTVFVEVRSRRAGALCRPEETITATKRKRITRAALWYLQQNRLIDSPARFDVVAITWGNAQPQIDWIVNAFEAWSG